MRRWQVRYLQSAKYKKYSGTWYADNFGAVVDRPDAITFDASPTTFSNIELAPGWIRKWLPQAKHLIMLRDPVQRTYSHWRMGKMWLEVSSCYGQAADGAPAGGARAPSAEMARMVLDEGSFPAQAHVQCVRMCVRMCIRSACAVHGARCALLRIRNAAAP